jgi:hypothetical protein
MGQSQSTWHKNVDALMAKHRARPDAAETFPLDQLERVTNTYLRRQRNLAGEKGNPYLIELVRSHPDKHVAIVACAHDLSRGAVRDLIRTELQPQLKGESDVVRYLQAILAANHKNPQVMSEMEADCAHTLLELCSAGVFAIGGHIKALAAQLASGVPRDITFCSVVSETPLNACRTLAMELETMRIENNWSHARAASLWLAGLPGTSSNVEQILDMVFHDWKEWAAWRPNSSRLGLWKKLSPEQQVELRYIIALEGPDISHGKATLREGLLPKLDPLHGFSVGYGRLLVKLSSDSQAEATTMLNELLETLDEACRACPSALKLFILRVGHKPVDAEIINLIKQVNQVKDSTVSDRVLSFMSAEKGNILLSNAKTLLSALNLVHCGGLREILGPQIVEVIEEAMSRLQVKLCEQFDGGRGGHGTAMKLHLLGESVRGASWLYPMLSEQLQSILRNWPSTDDIDVLFKLRADTQNITQHTRPALVDVIGKYCIARLTGAGEITKEMEGQVESLISLWHHTPYSDVRSAALAIAERSTIPIDIRRQCLTQLCNMGQEFIAQVLLAVKQETDIACINFAHLLMARTVTKTARECWRHLLLWMIEKRSATLLNHALSQLNVKAWLKLLGTLRRLFRDQLQNSGDGPPILQSDLHNWAKQLSENYIVVLTSLEEGIVSETTMRWILVGWEDSDTIMPILDALNTPGQGHYQPAIPLLLAKLNPDGSNARDAFRTLAHLTTTTPTGTDACMQIIELHKKSANNTAEGLLVGWLRATEMTAADRRALISITTFLGLKVYTSIDSFESKQNLQAASDYLDGEYNAIIEEAQRLESIRRALKTHNAQKTTALLSRIGIQDSTRLGNSASTIPALLVDVVEAFGEGEFEMVFPLAGLKPLQRIAWGVGSARILLVRLYLNSESNLSEFCIHLHPEMEVPHNPKEGGHLASRRDDGHYSWRTGSTSEPPDTTFCSGRANQAAYQLGRDLWKYLGSGFRRLEDTHKYLTAALDSLSSRCMVCGASLGAGRLRSTTCQKACSLKLRLSSLEMRLADLRNDPMVVDLLLTTVHAAATVSNTSRSHDLLPGCPLASSAVVTAIDGLPTLATLQTTYDLVTSVKSLGCASESLLSWLCTSYRGFLASATGVLKIPNMPGVHQFVVASASPEKEKAFAAHATPSSSSTVVFHGTSLDRLYVILRHGLHVMSNSHLQQNGAVYGPGIYVAAEPQTAMYYARQTSRASAAGWASSGLKGTRVLLGCEYVTSTTPVPVAPGIYCVRNETELMVRYVFLFPPMAESPIARHVEPAMKIAFNSLRVGSL